MSALIEIVEIDEKPLAEVRFHNASPRGRTETARLVVQRAQVCGLPDGLDALIATSDLQGVVLDVRTGQSTLLGVEVAQVLEKLAFDGVLPPVERTGVVLAGDLYSVPTADKRGGHGCVAPVWSAFAEAFAWVVGVAGNHDDMTEVATGIVLDCSTATFDDVRIGGVGLVCGNPAKLGRRSENDQFEYIELVLSTGIDLLILHEGPAGADHQPGNPQIRELVDKYPGVLTICGHVHWDEPLAQHRGGQILNVDTRVLVLTR